MEPANQATHNGRRTSTQVRGIQKTAYIIKMPQKSPEVKEPKDMGERAEGHGSRTT